MKGLKGKQWLGNVLSALAIILGGYVLFVAAFMLVAVTVNGMMALMGMPENATPPVAGRIIFLVLLAILSAVVFRLRIPDVVKATYLTMPLMVILVTIGLVFHRLPDIAMAGIGAVVIVGLVLFLVRKKLSWMYYFATAYVSVLALVMMLTGMDI